MAHSKSKSTPKDVFSYLLVMAAFYASVVSIIALLFQYVNVFFPDLDFYYTRAIDTIRRSISILIVVWPVYVFMSWFLIKQATKNPEKRKIKARKWLVYLTLFIASIVIIIDLVTLIYNFLGGEITSKFFLKLLVVLLVAVASFGYYSWDLRRDYDKNSSKKLKIIAWTASSIIIISIISGFFIVGSPATQRERRFDERRVTHLQTLQNEIINYWRDKDILPQNLEDLENSISGFSPPVDPKTQESYEYIVKDPLNFELCAVFGVPSIYSSDRKSISRAGPYSPGLYQQNWDHKLGRTCFSRTIDPDRYKKDMELRPMPVRELLF